MLKILMPARAHRQFVLTFGVLISASVGILIYSHTPNSHSGSNKAYANEAAYTLSLHKHGAKNYKYAQRDVGYGDGSVAVATDGLSKHLFPFDPNVADSTTCLSLGLRPWQVRSIYKYRAHGGRYRKPEDFARLYGLTLTQYQRLKPYICIKKEVMAADVVGQEKEVNATRYAGAATEKKEVGASLNGQKMRKLTAADPKVDINKADTSLLKRIPGIGTYYANKIVELRRQRKGFATVGDLLAIRNFPESALAYMKVSRVFSSLRVNTMTLAELQSHPLLTRTQANDVVALRRSSGRIKSVEELRMLNSFHKGEIERIAPYVVFD